MMSLLWGVGPSPAARTAPVLVSIDFTSPCSSIGILFSNTYSLISCFFFFMPSNILHRCLTAFLDLVTVKPVVTFSRSSNYWRNCRPVSPFIFQDFAFNLPSVCILGNASLKTSQKKKKKKNYCDKDQILHCMAWLTVIFPFTAEVCKSSFHRDNPCGSDLEKTHFIS